MGEKRTFLQFPFAHTRDVFALALPVITEHSLVKCMSIRIFGSCPGGIATGLLHKEPSKEKKRIVQSTWPNARMQHCLTIRRNSIVLRLIILQASMGINLEMLLTKRLLAMLTFEREKVDHRTSSLWALFADGKKLSFTFGCWSCARGRCWSHIRVVVLVWETRNQEKWSVG